MDSNEVSSIVEQLKARGPFLLRPLHVFDEDLCARIRALDVESLALVQREDGWSVVAGLHVWNDDLAFSHDVAQGLDNPTGSYWHGILHRREGDDSNARYWFRRAGDHPVHPFVQHHARALAQDHPDHPAAPRILAAGAWDPFAFVEDCSAGEDALMQAIQAKEIELLVRQCREALGHA